MMKKSVKQEKGRKGKTRAKKERAVHTDHAFLASLLSLSHS
jgi:hypothetical protein